MSSPVVLIALVGFVPFVLTLFSFFPPRRAAIAAFLLGWLFLPEAAIEVRGLPDFSKSFATSLAVLLGAFLFDSRRLGTFRLRLFDLPMLVWCCVPLVTSPLNGLGLYDGISWSLEEVVDWGLPYFLGRVYLCDREDLLELATGFFLGGLLYVPICLWEIRMSPNLHKLAYGFRQHSFGQSIRYGGFRPLAFMQNGLVVVLFMCMAFAAGYWMWRSGRLRRIWVLPVGPLLLLMLGTIVLCKTLIAAILIPLAVALPAGVRFMRTPAPLIVLLLAIPGYATLRTTGIWSGEQLVELVEGFDRDRAQSLDFRIQNENRLAGRALERPGFGWGRFSRSHVFDASGKDISVTDGRWIIALGQKGLVGLVAFLLVFMVPLLSFIRRNPAHTWKHAAIAPGVCIAVIVYFALLNNIPNAAITPLLSASLGGLVGLPRLGARSRAVAGANAAGTPDGAGGGSDESAPGQGPATRRRTRRRWAHVYSNYGGHS